MDTTQDLAAPCGLYCGVCAVYIAHRDDNLKFKERLTGVYNVGVEDIKCRGCLSDEPFVYCRTCAIKVCTSEKGIEGCHQCVDFPCKHIEGFPLPVGKKVILRAIPSWRECGTERWMEEEEKRYYCPKCGYKLFRGVRTCRNCKEPVDVD
jgi:ribosomal protein S27AE